MAERKAFRLPAVMAGIINQQIHTMKLRNIIVEIVALLYVCLLLYTGLAKLMDYDLSREQMAVMPLVGPFSGIATWLLPISEIILAVIIFIPTTRIKGLYVGTLLMLAFTIYVAYLMNYHSHLPCTCGGFLKQLSWQQHLLFNGTFTLLGGLAIYLTKSSFKSAKQTKLKYSH
jgi:uncharacterized membrane protein YphA (DoxX/SURF4 family)